ncbi:coiled-coil domain-containing protein 125 [Pelodytes ibericus]
MSNSLGTDCEHGLEEEEEDFMAGGDLGEGFGRKPGGLYVTPGGMAQTFKLRKGFDTQGQYHQVRKGDDTATASCHLGQRRLSEEKGIPKNLTEGDTRCRQNSIDVSSEISNEDLRQRLQELIEEVDLLRIELEASQKQLDGKDKALKILHSMAMFDKATSHTKAMLQNAETQRRALEKEINVLQWEIEFDQVRLKNLEESWKEKYDGLYCENAALKESLELRTNEVKALKSENTIVSHQCQELLAMLDGKRQKMFQDNVSLDKNSLTEVTALELAVLGACTCSHVGEPCSCAKMSAATRKQLFQLRQEFDIEKKSKEEAYVMADAFRIAFEQQLKRRNEETLPLSDMEKLCRKGRKHLNTWKQLKENGHLFSRDHYTGLGQKLKGMLNSSADCKNLESLDDPQEILRILIDLLNDKEEALAHQRKVSYMLARTIEDKVECTETQRNPESAASNHQLSSTSTRLVADVCNCLTNTEQVNVRPKRNPTRPIETSFSAVLKTTSPENKHQEGVKNNENHEVERAKAEDSKTQDTQKT